MKKLLLKLIGNKKYSALRNNISLKIIPFFYIFHKMLKYLKIPNEVKYVKPHI